MICPNCGAEVPASTSCPQCGQPLQAAERFADDRDDAASQSYVRASEDGYWETSIFEVKPASLDRPAGIVGESPDGQPGAEDSGYGEPLGFEGDELPQPEFAGASQANPSPQPLPDMAVAGNGEGQVAGGKVVTSGAFVLVIVGLVLSLLFLTCIPGLICSIIGLVLNARNSRSGAENPRKTTVNVLGVIGLVVGILMLAAFISAAMVAKQVIDTVNENGWDITQVQIVQGPDGTIVVREHSGAAPDATPVGILTASSSAASSDTGAGAAGSSPTGTSANSQSSNAALAQFDPKCLDASGNPTLYALVELNGTDLQSLLRADGFGWYEEITAWMRKNGTIFEAVNRNGNVSSADINRFGKGAANMPVVFVLSVSGYATPVAALDGLSAGVAIENRYEDDGALFAVVSNSSGSQFLVLVTDTGDGEQTFLIYGDTAISSGLFRDTIGIEVGSSVAEAWDLIAG